MLNPPTVPYSTSMLITIRQQLAKPIIRDQFAPSMPDNMSNDYQPKAAGFLSTDSSSLNSQTSSQLINSSSGYKAVALKVKKTSASSDLNSFVNKYMIYIAGGVVLIVAAIVYHHLQEKKQNKE